MKVERINPVLHRQIGHGIVVAGRLRLDLSRALPAGHQVNQGVLKIDPEHQDLWSGNVVAYRFADNTNRVKDLDLIDFGHVVDIIRYMYDHTRNGHLEKIEGPTTTGAFIPCASEERFGCGALENTPISAAQCNFQSEVASPIMTRIGIPLAFRRLPLETRWRDRKLGVPGKLIGWNSSLRFFDPTIPLCDRRHGVGSALAVRKGGKPLCETHVAAFVDYARENMVSYCLDNHVTARGVLNTCTKEDFLV